jgi:hypothetical protein
MSPQERDKLNKLEHKHQRAQELVREEEAYLHCKFAIGVLFDDMKRRQKRIEELKGRGGLENQGPQRATHLSRTKI